MDYLLPFEACISNAGFTPENEAGAGKTVLNLWVQGLGL